MPRRLADPSSIHRLRLEGLNGVGVLRVGPHVVWAIGRASITCIRDAGVCTIDTPVTAKREVWTDGDDLLWLSTPAIRIHPDGTRATEPLPPRPDRNPSGLQEKTCAWVGERLWEFREDRFEATLWVDGQRVPTSAALSSRGVAVAATEGALIVRHDAGVDWIDETGRCDRLATTPSYRLRALHAVFVHRGHVLWTEEDENEARLIALPFGAGPFTLERRRQPDTFSLIDVHAGRALLREERWVERPLMVMLEPQAVTVLELPFSAAGSPGVMPVATRKAVGLSLHDPIDMLSLTPAIVAALRSQGVTRIAELRDRIYALEADLRALGIGAFAQTLYAVAAYQVSDLPC